MPASKGIVLGTNSTSIKEHKRVFIIVMINGIILFLFMIQGYGKCGQMSRKTDEKMHLIGALICSQFADDDISA